MMRYDSVACLIYRIIFLIPETHNNRTQQYKSRNQ